LPRNGSGTHSIVYSFTSGTTISSSQMNSNLSDIASEITGSLPRDGQASMTGQMKASNGTAALPSMTFGSDPDTGFYRSAANTIGISAGGVQVGSIGSAGITGTIPAGTVMLFVQTAAPTGWTKSVAHNDKALRVVSGAAGTGGSTAFTTVFGSRTIAEANLPAHTHAAGTLATASDGAHTHTFTYNTSLIAANNVTTPVSDIQTSGGGTTVTTSSSGAHTHTISGSTGSIGSGTAMDFAVNYVDVIIATRDA
jgi:hypothetical protein